MNISCCIPQVSRRLRYFRWSYYRSLLLSISVGCHGHCYRLLCGSLDHYSSKLFYSLFSYFSICILHSANLNLKSNNIGAFAFCININNITIHHESTAKFSGVTIDDKLEWTPHINDRLLKIKRNKNMLQITKKFLSPMAKRLIYYGHIHSHLMYCLLVWGGWSKKDDTGQERLI